MIAQAYGHPSSQKPARSRDILPRLIICCATWPVAFLAGLDEAPG